MSVDGTYRTDNLSLAVVLDFEKYGYKLLKLTQRKVIWVFEIPPDREDEFEDLLDDFEEFRCSVEPRSYMLRHAEMRDEVFTVIPRPTPRSVVPYPAP